MNMNLGTIKTPIEVIKERAFGGTHFRGIYSSIINKWYRKSWEEFDKLKNLDKKYYCSNYDDISINKCKFPCETSFRLVPSGWIYSIDSHRWFR